MGGDLAAIIVEEFALLAHMIEHCAKAKAAGTPISSAEMETLSKPGNVELPDDYFKPEDLDRLRNAIDFKKLDDVWNILYEAMQRLTTAFTNSGDPTTIDSEIAAASRTICTQLSHLRVCAGGSLNHPVLEKLWLTFRCDANNRT